MINRIKQLRCNCCGWMKEEVLNNIGICKECITKNRNKRDDKRR